MSLPALFDELEKISMSLGLIQAAKSARTDRMHSVLRDKLRHMRFKVPVPAKLEGSLIKQQGKQFALDKAEKAALRKQPGYADRVGRLSRGKGTPRDPGFLDKSKSDWLPGMPPPDDTIRSAYSAGVDATVRRPTTPVGTH
jgi:hypothetical protein